MIVCDGKHYLYRHIRLDTNEVFYVGIGTKHKKWYTRSYNKTNRNIFWKRVVEKTDYEVEIVLESDDYDFIQQKEIEFIALYGRRNLGTGTLVNLTDGGEGALNAICSEEKREKIRQKNIGKPMSPISKLALEKYNREYKENLLSELTEKIYYSNEGHPLVVEDYKACSEVHVRFINTNSRKITSLGAILKGQVKDDFCISVHGVGYTGGKIKNKQTYSIWRKILKNRYGVCDEWCNYQNFTKWYEDNNIEGWYLLTNIFEDIKSECSNKNCFFLPIEFNHHLNETAGWFQPERGRVVSNFLSKRLGNFDSKEEAIKVYKKVKKEYLLTQAEKYKELFPKDVYEKIINYKIEIKKYEDAKL